MANYSPPPLPRRRGWGGCFLVVLLLGSMLLNLLFCGVALWPTADTDEPPIFETHLYGDKTKPDKIAVVRADGPLVEGLDAHLLRQIEAAGRDEDVKAVVVRIDSPGGTIGSSEDVHRELARLRKGGHPRDPGRKAKPLMASMGSIAASGGYYIAMPAEKVFAEKGTLTGSIGVYAALPNAADLAKDNGVKLELIKAGDIKGSGMILHHMTPAERQPWQDMVDESYDQFLGVVAAGRPGLTKDRLRNEVVSRKIAKQYDDKGNVIEGKGVEVVRKRADGGSFTATEAKAYGLIDDIGLLDDAVIAAAKSAGISEFRVVSYRRPASLFGALLGAEAKSPVPDAKQLANGLTPRVWYMAPGSEMAGVVAATSAK